MLCYVMLCYVMWNLFTVGSLQFCNDSAIASLEANQNRPNYVTRLCAFKRGLTVTSYFCLSSLHHSLCVKIIMPQKLKT